jgi:hypothetical protein
MNDPSASGSVSLLPRINLVGASALPAVIVGAREHASRRFAEFFTDNIHNPNTRAAYARATGDFFVWLDERGVTLERVEPVIVAAYVEQLGQT